MSIDLTKLTPAPWMRVPFGGQWKDEDGCIGVGHPLTNSGICDCENYWEQIVGGWCAKRTNIEFIALARNAFDVMMMRNWHAEFVDGRWLAIDDDGHAVHYGNSYFPPGNDPFTVIVDSDKWYREQVENKG